MKHKIYNYLEQHHKLKKALIITSKVINIALVGLGIFAIIALAVGYSTQNRRAEAESRSIPVYALNEVNIEGVQPKMLMSNQGSYFCSGTEMLHNFNNLYNEKFDAWNQLIYNLGGAPLTRINYYNISGVFQNAPSSYTLTYSTFRLMNCSVKAYNPTNDTFIGDYTYNEYNGISFTDLTTSFDTTTLRYSVSGNIKLVVHQSTSTRPDTPTETPTESKIASFTMWGDRQTRTCACWVSYTNIVTSSYRCYYSNSSIDVDNYWGTLLFNGTKTYNEGYDLGHSEGYRQGVTSGYSQGYDVGYRDGYDDSHGDIEISSNPFTLVRQAFDSVASILSIELLPNLPLGLLVITPVILVLLIAIVRMFKG